MPRPRSAVRRIRADNRRGQVGGRCFDESLRVDRGRIAAATQVRKRGAGDVDTAAVVLTFDDGALGHVAGSRYNGRGYDVRLELHGSRETIAVGLDDRVPLVSAEPGAGWPAAPPYPNFFERFAAGYASEIDNFIAHVRGQIDNPSSPADALEALYIAEAADRSRREDRPVDVAEVR